MSEGLPTTGSIFMIFGRHLSDRNGSSVQVRGWLYAGILWMWTYGLEAAPPTLRAILEPLMTSAPSVRHFEEDRIPEGLKKPLRTTGELEFIPPDRLIRRIDFPEVAEYQIEGGVVSITDSSKGESVRFELAEFPELESFAIAFRALLNGNHTLLETHFSITITGDPSRWQLELKPLPKAEPAGPERLLILGQKGILSEIFLTESHGTSSHLKLSQP